MAECGATGDHRESWSPRWRVLSASSLWRRCSHFYPPSALLNPPPLEQYGVSIIASTQLQTPRQTVHLITQGTASRLSHTPSSRPLYFHISSLQKPARTAVGPRPVSVLDVNAGGWREGREQMPLPPAVSVLSSLRLPVMSDRDLQNAARDLLPLEYQPLNQY